MSSAGNLIKVALNQSVDWHEKRGLDSYGQPRYKRPVTVPCRVSMRNRLVMSATGTEVTSTAQVTMLAAVKIGDKLTVAGRDYVVIDVKSPSTFSGQVHRRKAYI